jgi:membrane protein GlpM
MELLLKAGIGAAAVVLISLLARSRNYFIAALIPLFPTFGIIAFYTLGRVRRAPELEEAVLFGIFSLLPYLAFLLALLWLTRISTIGKALSVATLVWLLAALLLVLVWKQARP